MRRERVRLIIFAKAPVGGNVKTRLARDIGMAAATAWYRRALTRTQTMIAGAKLDHEIAAAPSAAALRAASSAGGRFATQAPGDLGRRMEFAAKRAGRPSLIFGVDIPALTPAILKTAREAVQRYDLVLGPARDGGFYLVGLKTPAHAFRLYDKVRWSSEHAMADTLLNAPRHWRLYLLPMLNDVDVAGDLAGQPLRTVAVAAWSGCVTK